jgi:hypothetical protein
VVVVDLGAVAIALSVFFVGWWFCGLFAAIGEDWSRHRAERRAQKRPSNKLRNALLVGALIFIFGAPLLH